MPWGLNTPGLPFIQRTMSTQLMKKSGMSAINAIKKSLNPASIWTFKDVMNTPMPIQAESFTISNAFQMPRDTVSLDRHRRSSPGFQAIPGGSLFVPRAWPISVGTLRAMEAPTFLVSYRIDCCWYRLPPNKEDCIFTKPRISSGIWRHDRWRIYGLWIFLPGNTTKCVFTWNVEAVSVLESLWHSGPLFSILQTVLWSSGQWFSMS